MTSKQGVIDAVITWVDGADPEHQRRRQTALLDQKRNTDKPILSGHSLTRFTDNGELRYCLRGLQEFAPWIRHIFIVTDRQTPPLNTWPEINQDKIKIVDHLDIFRGYEWATPTFNSLSIETMIWRIPELSEKFIYFNDDFFILREISPSAFFYDGGVNLQGSFKKIRQYGELHWKLSKTANLLLKRYFGIERSLSSLQQILAAQMTGKKTNYFKTNHTPYPMRKSTLSSYFSRNNERLKNNIKYQFRDALQFSTTSLANHLEIESGNAKIIKENSLMICFNRDTKKTIQRKIESLMKMEPDFLCLQSLEQAPKETREILEKFLLSSTKNI
jgi:hypothetical protein